MKDLATGDLTHRYFSGLVEAATLAQDRTQWKVFVRDSFASNNQGQNVLTHGKISASFKYCCPLRYLCLSQAFSRNI